MNASTLIQKPSSRQHLLTAIAREWAETLEPRAIMPGRKGRKSLRLDPEAFLLASMALVKKAKSSLKRLNGSTELSLSSLHRARGWPRSADDNPVWKTAMNDSGQSSQQAEQSERDVIDMDSGPDVERWTGRLGVSREVLAKAIEIAGNNASDVADYLANEGLPTTSE